jgi:hypothetical protein
VNVLGDFPAASPEDGGATDGGTGDGAPIDSSHPDATSGDSTRPDTTSNDSSVQDTLVADVRADTLHDTGADDQDAMDAGTVDGPREAAPGFDAMGDGRADSMQAIDSTPDAVDEPDVGVDASVDAPDATLDSGFSVGSVPGLVLWIEANHGVATAGNVVTQCSDQSPAGNNAVATGPSLPVTLTAPDFPDGLPGMTLGSPGGTPGTWQILQIADNPSLQFSADFLIETVVRVNAIGFGAVYEKQIPNVAPFAGIGMFLGNVAADGGPALMSWQVQFDDNRNLFGDASFLGPGADDVGNWRIYGVQRAGAMVSLRIDGQLNAQVDTLVGSSTWLAGPISVQAVGEDLGLGGAPGRYLFEMPMDVAEVIAVTGTLSAPNLTSIEGYLGTKYGIP